MGQPLTLDEVGVSPEDAAQVIYDLRRRLTPTEAATLPTAGEPDLPLPWGEFTVICKRCGGRRVTLDSSVGFSARSGAWGSVDMVCADCGNEATLWDTL